MKQLIITADDYGVFPSVNDGIIESLKQGKINSVSVLANFEGSQKYKSSKENLADLITETGKLDKEIEVGCHLTITSGKPLTGKVDFLCENGYFKAYTEMPNFKTPGQLSAVKDELCAQVEELQGVNGFKVMHLTNHHNSLTLFPHHFTLYMDVARKFGIPMRSPCLRPEFRQNVYLRFLNYALKDDIHAIDRDVLMKFSEEIINYFKANCNGVKAPEILDSRHYGPLAILPVLFPAAAFPLILKKRKSLTNLYESFKNSEIQTLELLFHLAKPSGLGVEKSKDLDYPGVDRNYFDSRVVEFRSIMGYDFTTWSEVEVKGWKYL